MPKSQLQLPGGEYVLVAERITLFYARFPEGRIITELVSRSGGEITFRALVYRSPAEREPAATGWAAEREGDGEVNAVACLENTETSAIGRALANLGFTASAQRPSAEEMAKASRARARLGRVPGGGAGSRGATPAVRRVAEPDPIATHPADDRLRADVRLLLEAAEREGVKPPRLAAARRTLDRSGVTREELERLERGVRAWLARRRTLPLATPAAGGADEEAKEAAARSAEQREGDVRGGALEG